MEEPVEIPYGALPAEILRRVVESFVLREGTDYGAREYTLEEKIAQVISQLERGEAALLFDPESQSIGIVGRRDQPRPSGGG